MLRAGAAGNYILGSESGNSPHTHPIVSSIQRQHAAMPRSPNDHHTVNTCLVIWILQSYIRIYIYIHV